MIPLGATLTVERLCLDALVIDEGDHAEPVNTWMIEHYTRLLTEQPAADTDPILVLIDADGRRRVRRGRHRVLGNRQAGRETLLAIVYCVSE
jgi:hypothetical protein